MFFKWTYLYKVHFQTLSCNTVRTGADQRTWIWETRFNFMRISPSTQCGGSFPFGAFCFSGLWEWKGKVCIIQFNINYVLAPEGRRCVFSSLPVSIVNGLCVSCVLSNTVLAQSGWELWMSFCDGLWCLCNTRESIFLFLRRKVLLLEMGPEQHNLSPAHHYASPLSVHQ